MYDDKLPPPPREIYYANGIVPPPPTVKDRVEAGFVLAGRVLTAAFKLAVGIGLFVIFCAGLGSLGIV